MDLNEPKYLTHFTSPPPVADVWPELSPSALLHGLAPGAMCRVDSLESDTLVYNTQPGPARAHCFVVRNVSNNHHERKCHSLTTSPSWIRKYQCENKK